MNGSSAPRCSTLKEFARLLEIGVLFDKQVPERIVGLNVVRVECEQMLECLMRFIRVSRFLGNHCGFIQNFGVR